MVLHLPAVHPVAAAGYPDLRDALAVLDAQKKDHFPIQLGHARVKDAVRVERQVVRCEDGSGSHSPEGDVAHGPGGIHGSRPLLRRVFPRPSCCNLNPLIKSSHKVTFADRHLNKR